MTDLYLAQYRIDAELGRGGMGVVYRAFDTKLDRTVALKVLPAAALASDDDRARFFREAKAAAQLSHPNVCHVYQVDEAVPHGEGVDPPPGSEKRPFIAMEYIEGDTLEVRIRKSPLKLTEAVNIAAQVAEALKAAHAKGIVHRDIKSANVMITTDGVAKVLDFGLAKTSASTQLTRQGSTLGTIAYMSPEQARGQEVDARTDLYSLGTVLYEMIAGRLPFAGDYEQAVVYGILNELPEPLTGLRSGVPMELERITGKLLAKDAGRRYQSANDLLADLKGVGTDLEALSGTMPGSRASMSSMSRADRSAATADGTYRRGAVIWFGVAGMVLGAVVAMIAVRMLGSADTTYADDRDVSIRVPGLDAVMAVDISPQDPSLALSPDGRLLAYAGTGMEQGLLVRDLTGNVPPVVISSSGTVPVFSPDSKSLAWGADGSIYRAPVTGGIPTVVTSNTPDPVGITWSPNGYLYLAPDFGRGIVRISEDGGALESVTTPDTSRGEIGHVCPTLLPDGRTLLVAPYGLAGWEMALMDLESGEKQILGTGVCPRFVPPDIVLFSQGFRLLAARFDIDSAALGDPVPLSEHLVVRLQSFAAQFDVSAIGDVVLVEDPSGLGRGIELRRFDGTTVRYAPDVFEANHFTMSSDGRSLAISSPYPVADPDIWLFDLETLDTRKIVGHPAYDAWPNWAPDGSLVFSSERRGRSDIWRLGPGETEPVLVSGLSFQQYPLSVSRDGVWVIYQTPTAGAGNDLFAARLDGSGDPIRVVDGDASEQDGHFSPTADLVAYTSDESGRTETYVIDFPPSRPRERVTVGGGGQPRWSRDGRSLYFTRENVLYRVSVSLQGRAIGEPERLMTDVLGRFELLPDESGIISSDARPTRVVRLIEHATDRVTAAANIR